MSYEVTATRRRPKTFDELAGQEFVAATLKNSLKTGHIAHAYLFSGPRGCGKTSAARILARALRCEKGPADNPCGTCPQCQEIARGSGLDVIEIDGASNTGVNHIRQIKEEVLFPPASGRYKIYIIDEVHMLSDSAFNALLKTIEEPPPYIIFIFATTELQKVPATIKSRCQQFNFRLIPIETIKALLAQACSETGVTAEDEALFWIARESTGSARDAYTLFDQVVSFSGGHISSALIREKLGLVGLEKLNEFAESCAANDLASVFSQIDMILEGGIAIEQFVEDLASYYHSLLLVSAGIKKESILGFPPERYSAKVSEKLDAARLAHAGELLYNLHRDMRYSISPRFELETLASKLCWLDRWVSPQDLTDAINRAGELLGGRHSTAAGSSEKFSAKQFPAGGLREGSIPAGNVSAAGASAANFPPENTGGSKVSFTKMFSQWQEGKKKGGDDAPEDFGVSPGNGDELKAALTEPAASGNVSAQIPSAQKTPAPETSETQNETVQTVLRIFNGTIVNNGENDEHKSL